MLHAKLTMYEAIQQVAATRLDQEALVCDEVRLTYGQLLARIDSQAQGLVYLGVGKGAKVACLIPPGLEFVYLFFALARLGAVIVPLNPQLRRQGLLDVLQHAQPIALVSAQSLDEGLLLQGVPSLQHFIPAGAPEPTQSGEGSLLSLEVSPQDLLALIYTSGTTGQPKGTMHTHSSLIAPVVASIKLREVWLHRPSLKSFGQTAKALGRYRTRLLRAAGRPQTFLSTTGWHTITGLEVLLQALLMGDRLW
jgi:acyl-CoA synthetase (AMP-forming)/AMP-acid ligase II